MGQYIFLYTFFVHAFTVYCEGIAECRCHVTTTAELTWAKNGRFFLHQGHTTHRAGSQNTQVPRVEGVLRQNVA
jgi:hypothetical protein